MDCKRKHLIAYLRRYVGNARIEDRTRIYHDLYISGDDADELLEKMQNDFHVDLEPLCFSEYFPEESESLIVHIARKLGRKTKKKPLTLRHLLKVIENGIWIEPDP